MLTAQRQPAVIPWVGSSRRRRTAPLRYVGVRLADSEPVDGPPSSATTSKIMEDGRLGRPCRPGARSRGFSENQVAASPPLPFQTGRSLDGENLHRHATRVPEA